MINQNAPLYIQFANAIRTIIREQGLPAPTAAATPSGFPENDNWFFVEWGTHLVAPALIVPKSKTRMGNLHSHIDLSSFAGYIPLPKKNGRVVCHFQPDVSKVSEVLSLFIGASKRPIAPPVRRLISASQAPVVFLGDSVVDESLASQAPVNTYSDDDADDAIRAMLNT